MQNIVVKRKQTVEEEIVNALLHGAGALLASAGLALLVMRAALLQSALPILACAIYAGSLVLLFLFSTLYHAFPLQRAKRVFQILDHCAIYLLIAGTYTPLCLLAMPRALGVGIVIGEWFLALMGVTLHAVNIKVLKKLELALYIFLGWAPIAAGGASLLEKLPVSSIILLGGGGLLFTIGVYFYKKNEKKFFHVTWHAFVLAASILQWQAIFLFTSVTSKGAGAL